MMSTYEIRKAIVETKLEHTMASQQLDRGRAMEGLVYSLLFGCSVSDVPAEDNVGGNQEKQIDFLYIDDQAESARAIVHVIQIKAGNSFASNE